jgi:phospholipid/cholesterol/gamma-HCH transport system ATP-binding protein
VRLISYQGVWKRFGPKVVYENLSLDIEKGEIITIIGGSGSGKSVMLKMLIGLLAPDRGRILFDGVDVIEADDQGLLQVRRRIGMLFQGAALFDSLSVGENVAYGLREHLHLSDQELWGRVAKKLSMVGLEGVEHMAPADLSGGMKKRVALARAIAVEPEVVLYDEPTTGLDPINATRINQLIQHLNDELHITSIIVTHDMDSAFSVSDRIAMLAGRRIVTVGTVDEIRQSPLREVQDFIQGTYRGSAVG